MFTALTLNIQNGEPWTGCDASAPPANIQGTLDFLKAHPADFLFLQEVEQGHEGGSQVSPPPHYEFLKDNLPGYHSVFGYPQPNPDEIPFGLGLAIFSKWPLRNFWREDLPPADVSFEYDNKTRRPSWRLLIGVEAETPEGAVSLMNTHLQAFFMISSSSNEHLAQRDLVEKRLRLCSQPTLLAGDFNCAPGETVVEQFAKAGFHPVQTSEITWRRRPYVLDHIFHNSGFIPESWKVIPTEASDHHAVQAAFRLAT